MYRGSDQPIQHTIDLRISISFDFEYLMLTGNASKSQVEAIEHIRDLERCQLFADISKVNNVGEDVVTSSCDSGSTFWPACNWSATCFGKRWYIMSPIGLSRFILLLISDGSNGSKSKAFISMRAESRSLLSGRKAGSFFFLSSQPF